MAGERCKTLPDELVERIIARVPFPYIYKAQGLSKSWLARFSPVSSLHTAAEKCRAIAFQKLVRERSKDSVTFSPVSIEQIAYNPASHIWHRMPSLRNLPWKANSSQEIVGPLLLVSRRPEFPPWNEVKRCRGEVSQRPHLYNIYEDMCPMPHELNYAKELCVTNMLTRSWKLFPPRPNVTLGYAYLETLILSPSLETYMVIAFCRDHGQDGVCNGYSAQIYDSKSATWSRSQLRNPRSFFGSVSSHAYFNGVIYMVQDALMHCLMAYDVEARTWKELRLSDTFYNDIEETFCVDLVVCNSNLMMVVQVGEPPDVECLWVLKVDLELLQLSKVFKCPPRFLNISKFMASPPSSDGRSIFLGYDNSDGRMVVRKVDEALISFEEKRKKIKEKKWMMKMKIKAEKQMTKMKIKEEKWMMKMKIKAEKQMTKMKIKEEKWMMKMSLKTHADDGTDENCEGEENEDDDEEDEDDDDYEDEDYYEDEDDYEDDEEDKEDYEDEGDWICFHSLADREMPQINLKDQEILNNGEGSKKRRRPRDKMKKYKWCFSSFQPGLNPFMAV